MAVMWPRELPREILANSLRSSECEVYRRLEAALDNTFVVFYSRPWLGLRPNGEEIDGECDFVVAHPEYGLLSLEVKGGAVAYDPLTERWTSRDRWGITHNIKNPVRQARDSKHQILEKLRTSHAWATRRIRARHGVVLPHSASPGRDLGVDMPLRIFCFEEDFETDLFAWILARFGDIDEPDRHTQPLGQDGIRALEDILARPFQLHAPLGHALYEDDRAIQHLTQQQFHILRAIEEVPRAAISGAAGTGKTILATEEAVRCAEKGMRTLYTCYNRPLAEDVNRRLGHFHNIEVVTFHGFCTRIAAEAGIVMPDNEADARLYAEVYPEVLMQGLDLLPGRRFDAIIVDEGQDILPLWWTALDSALDTVGSGLLRVFHDSNQRVYGNATKLPDDIQLVPIRLTLNLRNTRRIHEVASRHYKGHAVDAAGPEGMAVEWAEAGSLASIRRLIHAHVSRLTGPEHVKPRDIAVLAANDGIVELLSPGGHISGMPCRRCDASHDDGLTVDTIRRFKGLERPVVIVAVTPEVAADPELAYVALTRGRTELILVGDPASLASIRNPRAP